MTHRKKTFEEDLRETNYIAFALIAITVIASVFALIVLGLG